MEYVAQYFMFTLVQHTTGRKIHTNVLFLIFLALKANNIATSVKGRRTNIHGAYTDTSILKMNFILIHIRLKSVADSIRGISIFHLAQHALLYQQNIIMLIKNMLWLRGVRSNSLCRIKWNQITWRSFGKVFFESRTIVRFIRWKCFQNEKR